MLDEVDALNLWTRVQDQEQDRARQFNIPVEGPAVPIVSAKTSGEDALRHHLRACVDVAAEFGADYVFIDPVWEHQQAFQETLDALIPPEQQKGTVLDKFWHQPHVRHAGLRGGRNHGR